MNNRILKHSNVALILLTSLTGFSQTNSKIEKARKDSVKAENKIRLAKIDSAADFQKFKTESEAKILENKKQIAILKKKKLNGSDKANRKYDKDVLALEKRNNDLEIRINEADDTPTNGWEAFKRGFNNSMEDLGCAMKNVGSCAK